MFRNNLFSFLTHIICIVISIIFAVSFRIYCTNLMIFSIYLLILYIIVGAKLRPQESGVGNFLSISIIPSLGLLLYGMNLIFSKDLIKGLAKLYALPITNVFMQIPNYMEKSIIDNPVILIILFFVPTFLLGLGLEFKKRIHSISKFHLLLIYIICFFGLIATVVMSNIFAREIVAIRFNYKGDKYFIEERFLKNYYLYYSDLKLKNKRLIYSGTSPMTLMSPNPAKNIILFTYRANKNDRDQILCLYNCAINKYVYKEQQYLDKILWSKNGDKLYLSSYHGLASLDLKDMQRENCTQKYLLPVKKGFPYDCFKWSNNGDKLTYAIFSDLYIFDLKTGVNQKLKSLDLIKSTPFDYQEYFTGVFFLNNDQSVLYSYQKGPEFPGKIGIFDLKTHSTNHVYSAPNDLQNQIPNSCVDLSIESIISDKYIIISEYEMVNEVDPQRYTVYLFNLKNKKSVQLYRTYDTSSTWDCNSITKKVVCINNNRLKIIGLKPFMRKIK